MEFLVPSGRVLKCTLTFELPFRPTLFRWKIVKICFIMYYLPIKCFSTSEVSEGACPQNASQSELSIFYVVQSEGFISIHVWHVSTCEGQLWSSVDTRRKVTLICMMIWMINLSFNENNWFLHFSKIPILIVVNWSETPLLNTSYMRKEKAQDVVIFFI